MVSQIDPSTINKNERQLIVLSYTCHTDGRLRPVTGRLFSPTDGRSSETPTASVSLGLEAVGERQREDFPSVSRPSLSHAPPRRVVAPRFGALFRR